MGNKKEQNKTNKEMTILEMVEKNLYDPKTMTDNQILEYIRLKEKRDHIDIWYPYVNGLIH